MFKILRNQLNARLYLFWQLSNHYSYLLSQKAKLCLVFLSKHLSTVHLKNIYISEKNVVNKKEFSF